MTTLVVSTRWRRRFGNRTPASMGAKREHGDSRARPPLHYPQRRGTRPGHIAFSLVTITSSTATIEALGLAPMAVLPEFQRRGIGSQLVEAGLTACHHTPYGVVVVLGHPHYYPRLEFTPAKPLGIMWEHEVP